MHKVCPLSTILDSSCFYPPPLRTPQCIADKTSFHRINQLMESCRPIDATVSLVDSLLEEPTKWSTPTTTTTTTTTHQKKQMQSRKCDLVMQDDILRRLGQELSHRDRTSNRVGTRRFPPEIEQRMIQYWKDSPVSDQYYHSSFRKTRSLEQLMDFCSTYGRELLTPVRVLSFYSRHHLPFCMIRNDS
jgi:hypothetical protein